MDIIFPDSIFLEGERRQAYRDESRRVCGGQAYLPHLDREKGILMSLNVEAVK